MNEDVQNSSRQNSSGQNSSGPPHAAQAGVASTAVSSSPTIQHPSPECLKIKMKSDPAQLREVRKITEAFALSSGCPTEITEHVGLVLNEALANVIRHGYRGDKEQPIDVTVEKAAEELWVTIRDWGVKFDPSKLPYKNLTDNPTPGGLGLVCIRRFMDDVKYEQLPDGMRLKMGKRL